MERIRVSNFGPIEFFEEDISNMNIFVGPQASGKSTISKLIYYFKSIPYETNKYLISENKHLSLGDLNKILRSLFVGFFGTTKHMKLFEIEYIYNNNSTVTLTIQNGYLMLYFNNYIVQNINKLIKNINISNKNTDEFFKLNSWHDIISHAQKNKIVPLIVQEIESIFGKVKKPMFIPAGRSLVSTLSEQLKNIEVYSTDLLIKEFIEKANSIKYEFNASFEDIIQDKKMLTTKKLNISDAELAIKVIRNILKGKYVFSDGVEKIFFSENEFTKIQYSSSGQQEVIYIVLMLFMLILENQEVFIVIEEPEAHLYPSAQKEIVSLIALLSNSTNSDFIITTHSPYILSSLNIYLYANKVKDKLSNNLFKDLNIHKNMLINIDHLNAFIVDNENNFSYNSIIDSEEKLINSDAIDRVSGEINRIFDKLIDLELEVD